MRRFEFVGERGAVNINVSWSGLGLVARVCSASDNDVLIHSTHTPEDIEDLGRALIRLAGEIRGRRSDRAAVADAEGSDEG